MVGCKGKAAGRSHSGIYGDSFLCITWRPDGQIACAVRRPAQTSLSSRASFARRSAFLPVSKKIIQGRNGVQACSAYLVAGSTTPPINEIRNEI